MQVALFAFHKARERTIEVDNPFAHARTVLQRAMWGHYTPNATRFDEKNMLRLIDERDAGMAPSTERLYHIQRGLALAMFASIDGRPQDGTQPELFELEDYFEALEKNCGSLARTIAVNLVSPTGDCSRRILEQAERKQRMQQQLKSASKSARRHQPRGVQSEIRLSQRVIRTALGISPTEWARNMTRIKDFTRSWLAQ